MNDEHSYRKVILGASLVSIFVCGAISSFSVFRDILVESTHSTTAQVLLTLTINQITMACFGIVSGKIVDKIGPKLVMTLGGAIFGLGWFLTAFVSSIPMLYLATGMVVGMGNGLIYNPALNTCLKWFPEKKGTIMGCCLCAASAGTFALAKAGAWLCATFGQMGFAYFGIAFLVAGALAGFFMKAPAATTGAAVVADAGYDNSLDSLSMIKTLRFWFMFILFILAATASTMMVGALSNIAQAQLGVSPLEAANFVAINALSYLVGRLLVGRVYDKIGPLKMLAVLLVLIIAALLGMRFVGSHMVGFILCLVVLSLACGGLLVVYPPFTASQFGMRYQGMNYGIMFLAYAIGTLVGPQIAAGFVDSSLGAAAYSSAYVVAALVTGVGLVLCLVMSKKLAHVQST